MTLWLVLTVLISATGAALAVALVRRQDERRDRPGEAAALRSEIADLDAQVAAGVLPASTAEGLRAETIRRFLGRTPVDRKPARPLGRGAQMALAVVLAAGVALGAAALYAKLGSPRLAAVRAPAADSAPAAESRVADLLPQLEAKVRANPDDPTGQRLLGGAYMAAGRFADAASAYRRLADLASKDAEARSGEGEALTRAADGKVTPEAADAFQAALGLDPTDPRARYFLALRKDQAGDRAGAMADWIALLKSAPPGAPWADQVRSYIQQLAAERHEDISGKLPAATSAAPATSESAASQPMVQGMVQGLDARLRAQPRDLQGWIMLMRARMVMKQPQAAGDAFRRGLEAFRESPGERAQLKTAAGQLGVPGA